MQNKFISTTIYSLGLMMATHVSANEKTFTDSPLRTDCLREFTTGLCALNRFIDPETGIACYQINQYGTLQGAQFTCHEIPKDFRPNFTLLD